MRYAGRDSPLLLVVDLDETLVHVDEENALNTHASISIFYRTEIFGVFQMLRKWFRGNSLFLVLWSTGDDAYVKDVLRALHIRDYFDLVLGRKDSRRSENAFGAPKAISYLLRIPKVRLWLREMVSSSSSSSRAEYGYPVYAIVDDRARENTRDNRAQDYDYVFAIEPINLSTISQSQRSLKLFAKSTSLTSIAYYLVEKCLLENAANFSVSCPMR